MSKTEEITFTGKAARFIGYETLGVGIVVLVLLFTNLLFSLVDAQILFFIVLMITVALDVFVHQKGYSMYLEAPRN